MLPRDVANPDEVNEAARLVIAAWGGIDVWVNNATVSVFSPGQADDAARLRARHAGQLPGRGATARWRRWPTCCRAIAASSSRSARRRRTMASRCSRRMRRRSTRCCGFTESLRAELLHDGSHVHVTMVELPATNTPQFDWLKNRMARQPRPAPPIYQPEVAAEAIYHAALHPRPHGLTDVLLARTGYRAQQLQAGRRPRIRGSRPTCGRRSAAITGRTGGSIATRARGACRCGPRCTGAPYRRASRRWSRCRGSASAGPAAELSR